MDFFEACKAMDEGKTVKMAVNPEKHYKLAKDGETYVSWPIQENGEWTSAIFFTRHIRGEWVVVG